MSLFDIRKHRISDADRRLRCRKPKFRNTRHWRPTPNGCPICKGPLYNHVRIDTAIITGIRCERCSHTRSVIEMKANLRFHLAATNAAAATKTTRNPTP